MASLQTIAIDPEAFSTRFKISIWVSIVATAPVIPWQILLAFFCRRLNPNERKWFMPTFAAAVVLFIFGTVFCYLIILNPAFQWLTDQAMGLGDALSPHELHIDTIIKFELAFGWPFELPLVIPTSLFSTSSPKKLRGVMVVYVVLMVVCAMATPDASAGHHAAHVRRHDRAFYEGSLLIARVCWVGASSARTSAWRRRGR